GLQSVRQDVEVDHVDAEQPGDFVEDVVVRDDLAFQMLSQHHQLQIDRLSVELCQLAVITLEVDTGVAPQPVEDIKTAASATSPQLVGAVGNALKLAQNEPRHNKWAIEHLCFDHVGDAAVDHHARVQHVGLDA